MTSYLPKLTHDDHKRHIHLPMTTKRQIKNYTYNESDKIGSGYSSIVYRGKNQNNNQTVAVKAINMKEYRDSVSRQMLQCEIEALSTIQHNNVLRLYDVIREGNYTYIVTEWCSGGDMSGMMKIRKKLSENQTIHYLRDIISGLIQIGENKYLHRDLKLANIFIEGDRAIIADFGFSKKSKSGIQMEKYNVGSPLYMSPEALKKNKYTLGNDIWSIGIMAYQMLHGQTPWECRTEKELLNKMLNVNIKFRDSLKISEPTQELIKKCLRVDDQKRMTIQGLKAWLSSTQNAGSSLQQKSLLNAELKPSLNAESKLKQIVNTTVNSSVNASMRPLGNIAVNPPVNASLQMRNKNNKGCSTRSMHMGKENRAVQQIKKEDITKNNNTLIIEINRFRILYKIYDRLRTFHQGSKTQLNIIGNEIIRMVTCMKSFCQGKYSQFETKQKPQYNIKNIEKYLNEESNPSITKYKSVINEYYTKYSKEIQLQLLETAKSPREAIMEFLKENKIDEENQKQLMMKYWMIEYCLLTEKVTKRALDDIIDAKQVTKDKVNFRMKELLN